MENKIKSIRALLSAFESRNEILHEEIKKNEEAMEEMKAELSDIIENNDFENSSEENKLKLKEVYDNMIIEELAIKEF